MIFISSSARTSAVRALVAAAICSGALSLATSASAQTAAELDKKARAAFENEEYELAARTFEEAYKLKPHPATQYNAALAWERAGELARAADAFESALLSEGLDEGRAAASRDRLSALKRQLGYVSVPAPIGGTVSVDHAVKVPIPAKIHVSPGSHELTLRRPDGTTEKQSISARAGEVTTVEFSAGGGLGPGPAEATDPKPSAPSSDPVSDQPADGSCSQCTWGWVAIGGAVVAAGVGTYFGLRTLSARDEFEESDREDRDARNRAITSRALSNVAFGAAVVSAGVGVVLLLTAKSSDEEASARQGLSVRIGASGISAAYSF